MGKRFCLDCARLIEKGSRCHVCHTKKRRKGHGSTTYIQNRRTVLSAHLALHGNTCPGYNRAAHAPRRDNPLTVDHIKSLEKGGTHDLVNLRVLCRRCNSRKGSA